jgi:transposase-like protein
MESLTSEVVDEILNGFSNNKPINCPICKAKFVLINQDIQAKSNFYYCAKCGLTFHKSRK